MAEYFPSACATEYEALSETIGGNRWPSNTTTRTSIEVGQTMWDRSGSASVIGTLPPAKLTDLSDLETSSAFLMVLELFLNRLPAGDVAS